MDREEIERLVAEHGRWWHEIELAPGIVTPGDDSNRMKLPILDALGLPRDLRGQRALDIGCSDGYFSFELERRGADVVAIDFVPESYGRFDVVLFLGVLYHLRKPLAALDAIRSVMHEGGQLFVGTMLIDEYFLLPDGTTTTLDALDPRLKDVPLWQFYPGDSLNGDYTNAFAPNRRALEAALQEAQFRVDDFRIVSMGGYARATAVVDSRMAKYQRLDSRLETTPFDPAVPYFLDEEGSVHEVTGQKK